MSRDTVVVIDDDENFRELVKTVCELNGARAVVAVDCISGVELVSREASRVRLVLIDYFMPGMSPADCVNAVRAVLSPEALVMLVTAAVDPEGRANEVGLTRWLSKPFEIEELEKLLGDHVP